MHQDLSCSGIFLPHSDGAILQDLAPQPLLTLVALDLLWGMPRAAGYGGSQAGPTARPCWWQAADPGNLLSPGLGPRKRSSPCASSMTSQRCGTRQVTHPALPRPSRGAQPAGQGAQPDPVLLMVFPAVYSASSASGCLLGAPRGQCCPESIRPAGEAGRAGGAAGTGTEPHSQGLGCKAPALGRGEGSPGTQVFAGGPRGIQLSEEGAVPELEPMEPWVGQHRCPPIPHTTPETTSSHSV